jgi:hypothetical protein
MIRVINIIILSVCFASVLTGCAHMQQLPPDMPDDFGFTLYYGPYGKNILNTFEQTYTKDLIGEGQVTVKLAMTKAELRKVYERIIEIGIMCFPGSIEPEENVIRTWEDADRKYDLRKSHPFTLEQLRVRMNGEEHGLSFFIGVCHGPTGRIPYTPFYLLIQLIQEILYDKSEYRVLPPADGVYG